ncbi:hypothetical protein [Pelagicoccus sp. SDUM812003]|uniref:hypothetical protein n=1 Tax=Pelagicoccus sp. SDUM812003 TaxID=3041267 RepID=UPI002810728E|nr:hypothetical protein [Pelagicoccus sp. SDUM812003]MDQ8202735.1 hypothetical protein [Pelagicoccus sp. SDUM812003]
MTIDSSSTAAQAALASPLTALKNAKEAPGKAALKVIEGVAEQVEQSQPSGPVGGKLNVKA